MKSKATPPTAVSYTHLDVYKRQDVPSLNLFFYKTASVLDIFVKTVHLILSIFSYISLNLAICIKYFPLAFYFLSKIQQNELYLHLICVSY